MGLVEPHGAFICRELEAARSDSAAPLLAMVARLERELAGERMAAGKAAEEALAAQHMSDAARELAAVEARRLAIEAASAAERARYLDR